jgi:RNA polymerase sigma-70 factor, ECF subfamily
LLAAEQSKMSSPVTPTDQDLLRQMKAGDEPAFTLLYRRRQGGVFRFAYQMSGSRELAEDVTQEVFMTLIREADRYDEARGGVVAYLYGIARNQVLRRFERERQLVPIEDALESEFSAGVAIGDSDGLASTVDPLRNLTRGETIEAVRSAILALPAHYREVVVLCELEEMSYADAAAVIGCALGTVRSRLHRARALLTERLRSDVERSQSSTEPNEIKPARCFA